MWQTDMIEGALNKKSVEDTKCKIGPKTKVTSLSFTDSIREKQRHNSHIITQPRFNHDVLFVNRFKAA